MKEENPVVELKEEERNKSAMPVIENAKIKIGFESCDLGFAAILGLPIFCRRVCEFTVSLVVE